MPDLATEDLAAERLAGHLRGQGRQVTFDRPSQDPPDFVFTVDGERWAVEHTQLQDYQEAAGEPLSGAGVREPFFKLAERLNRETEGRRKSGWVLEFLRSFSEGDWRTIQQQSRAAILADDPSVFGRSLCRCPAVRQEPCALRDHEPVLRFSPCHCPVVHYRPAQCPGSLPVESDFRCSLKCARAGVWRLPDVRVVSVFAGADADGYVPSSDTLSANIQANIDFAVGNALEAKVHRLEAAKRYARLVLLLDKVNALADAVNVTIAIVGLEKQANRLNRVYFVAGDKVCLVGGRDAPRRS